MSCKLEGVTEPGNTVELDGKPLAVGAVGIFNDEIRLRMGDNTFKLVARNSEGGLRVNHLNVVVSYKKEDGKYFIAVKPGPYMTVNLPPKGTLLRSLSLAVSGATGPENRINVNGKPATVQPDGGFLATVELPEGSSLLVIEVTDPEGYTGVIEHEVEVSETRLFFLAFADAKMGILQGRGYLEGAGMDDPEEYFTEGRAAFYLKGHVLGKYLITAAFDTGANEFDKMFKDLDESENDRLLTNLDPDKLYPVYGDSSTIVYDTESQGKLYLAVESDEFNLLVGNYQLNLNDTELATFQRTLYGERIEYQSASRTKYGEPHTKITVFGAEVRQAHIRDELSATGGSLYYLSHKHVIEGSEQVTIIIRDKDTGLMVSKLQQQQNVDYRIKYEEGRIMFNRPISSVVEDDRLIDRALLSGSPVFVQVDYETAVESFDKTGYGGRARKQIGDHVAVGGTYVKDELAAGKYKLTSFDSEVRLGMNTRFLVEYAESSGTDAIIYRSDNGGLTYSEETPAGILEGSAWKTSAELDIGEWFGSPDRIQAGGYYKKLDSGFLSSGNFIERGTEKFGVNLKLQITEPDKLLARYDREEFETGISIDNNQTGSGTIQLVHDKDWWNLAGEYSMRKSEGEVDDSTSLGALRLRMRLNEKLSVSAEHQQTITGTENNQTTLGSEYQILPSLALSVAGTTGTLGRSAQGGAVFSLGNKRVYLTERISEDNGGRTTSTVLGTEAPVGNASKVYSEYQWERSDGDNRQLSLVGAEKKWDMTKGLKLLVAGEHTDIDSDSGGSSRYTLATGLSYVLNGFNASTRNEVRKEEGDNERVQYLTTNSVELKLSPDYTLLGKYKYSITRDMDNDSTEAELNESGIGLAYRPVEFDRLNGLARYTHLSDQRPLSLGEMEPLVTTMDVTSIEWSLDVTSYLEWVEKYALKVKTEETGDRPAVTTHTYLVINRFNFNVWRSFDLGVEYRVLVQKEADDKRQGWLTELMWNATEHIRLGLGYNFTDFSDNEFSDNNYSVRGCFIRLQAKY
ncbi:MAG: hypothetical protein KAJ10_01810 [Thermodesulfovibrionia bacterium]|nr:hypothetical protein [Thermodesulfovibrionia bacterium]